MQALGTFEGKKLVDVTQVDIDLGASEGDAQEACPAAALTEYLLTVYNVIWALVDCKTLAAGKLLTTLYGSAQEVEADTELEIMTTAMAKLLGSRVVKVTISRRPAASPVALTVSKADNLERILRSERYARALSFSHCQSRF